MTRLETIVAALRQSVTPMSLADIAEATGISADLLVNPIHAGIHRGMVYKRRDPSGGRRNLYYLTDFEVPAPQYRACASCGQTLPLDSDHYNFRTRKGGQFGRTCKACLAAKKAEAKQQPRVLVIAPGHRRITLLDAPLKRAEPFKPAPPHRGGQSSIWSMFDV
jgi:hypothetical protein